MAQRRSNSSVLVFSVVILFGFTFMLSYAQTTDKPVTDICLGCICEAISGCNQTAICQGGVCGLFRITWPYWADGGKLTVGNDSPQSDQAYANCANDPYCAAATIQGYMSKYAQDCDGDGAVNCYDYARIHKLGGFGCTGDIGYQYQNTLQTCLNQFQNLDVRSTK